MTRNCCAVGITILLGSTSEDNNNDRNAKIGEVAEDKSSYLDFTEVTDDDEGQYTCEITNAAGKLNSTSTLTVNPPGSYVQSVCVVFLCVMCMHYM